MSGLARAEKELVAEYDRQAHLYDHLGIRRFYDQGYGGSRERALMSLFRGCGSVLDVACGTGRLLSFLAGASTLVGTDLSANMLKEARRKNPSSDLVRCDVQMLPFRDAAFDFAACSRAFKFFSDPLLALQEMSRCLAKGGRMTISLETQDPVWIRMAKRVLGRYPRWQPGNRDTHYRSQSIQAMLVQTGYRIIALRCIYYLPRYIYELAPHSILAFLQRFDESMKTGRFNLFVAEKA